MTGPDLPDHARRAAVAAYRGWRIGDDGEGRLHAALVAYERQRATQDGAKLDEIRSVLLEGGQGDATARCRAIAIAGTEEAAPLTAVCTGPDCGDQFADSETSEYEFATRDRMERLLYADGWSADPVLCRACQPEPSPAGQDAAGQIPLPGVA
jgi:hypothetical protein